jgi:hypothetical protein
MPGFDNNLEHSIFAGDRHPFSLLKVEYNILIDACVVYKWLLGDTDADDIENADIGEFRALVLFANFC